MHSAAAWPLASILGALSALHFYWATGGRWGLAVAIPQTRDGSSVFQPGRVACVAVAFALLLAAAVALASFDPWLKMQLLRALAVIFVLRGVGDFRYVGFTKRIRDTSFAEWDTKLYSPLCVLMALLAWVASNQAA